MKPVVFRGDYQATKENYEKRIDELFAGAEPNNDSGIRVLDRGDVLDLLGHGDMPVVLNEKHAIDDGQFTHPLTAEQWKRIPDYLDNPVAVFERPDGYLTFITSELVNGKPLIIGVAPSVEAAGGRVSSKRHLVLTAYVKDNGKLPIQRMIDDGELRYVDTRKSPEFNTGSRLQLPSSGTDLRGLAHKVHTGADLFKYRKAKDVKPDVYLSKQKNKDSNAPRTLESMGVLSDDGIQPDLLADAFGFPSVEAMVKALLTAPDPVSAIKRLTDEIMVQRHADLATPQAIEQAALAALHSEAHCIKPCAISLLRKSA